MKFSKKVFLVLCLQVMLNIRLAWTVNIDHLLNAKVAIPIFGTLNPIDMETISAGALLGMKECEKVFKWERWNCPSSVFLRQAKYDSTREKAYAEAIVAAAVVYQITKKCSKGLIKNCSCNQQLKGAPPTFNQLLEMSHNLSYRSAQNHRKKPEEKPEWVWGGCSDDSTYAENVFTKYLKQLENGQDAQSFISRYNSNVGKNVIRESMEKVCRCHGTSGSCVLQSCWMRMVPFEKVAKILFERYHRAKKISFEGEHNELAVGNSGRFPPELIRQLSPKGLIYLDESPNYCEVNGGAWNGTAGRMCATSVSEDFKDTKKRNCRRLCRKCGRKVRKQERVEFYPCRCTFVWCCEAKCDVCKRTVKEFYCQ